MTDENKLLNSQQSLKKTRKDPNVPLQKKNRTEDGTAPKLGKVSPKVIRKFAVLTEEQLTQAIAFKKNVSISWGCLQNETSMFNDDVASILQQYPGITNLRLVNNVSCISGYSLGPRTEGVEPIDMHKFIAYLDEHKLSYKYKPTKFSGLSYKHNLSVELAKFLYILTGKRLKTTTFLCFKSGQIVMVGLKSCSIEFLRPLVEDFLGLLADSDALTGPMIYKPHISNMVFSFSLDNVDGTVIQTLPLYKLSSSQLAKKHVQYFPILFPGAKVLIPNSSAICTLFTSRKAIFTGGGGYNLKHFSEGMKLLKSIVKVIGINITNT